MAEVDIVDWLRQKAWIAEGNQSHYGVNIFHVAADEIERLRSEVERLRRTIENYKGALTLPQKEHW